jgi:DNA-directed RNA polymerase specialized sigma24 family protein
MKDSPKINADMWVDQYGDSLFHFALARVKNKEIAEDLVQETKERIKKALRAAP